MKLLITVLTIYNVAVIALGCIPATAYPLFYRRSPWRDFDAGRALMVKAVAIAILFDVSLLLFALAELLPVWVILAVQAVQNTIVVAAVTYQFSVLRKLQTRPGKPAPGNF